MSWNVKVNNVQYQTANKASSKTNVNIGNVNSINVTSNGAQIVLNPQNQNVPQYQTQTAFYSQPVGFVAPIQIPFGVPVQVPGQFMMQTAYQPFYQPQYQRPSDSNPYDQFFP